MGQGHTSIEGMPELPIFTTFYQLDPSKTYDFDFQVLDSYFIENILVFPHQGMESWDVESVNIINEDAYDSQIPYPEKNLVISDRHQGRGIEFISLSVTPYKYYPKHKKLEVFSYIEIQIMETGDRIGEELNQPKRSHVFDQL